VHRDAAPGQPVHGLVLGQSSSEPHNCLSSDHRADDDRRTCFLQATIGLGTPIGQVPKAVISNPRPKLVPAYSLKTPLLALAEPPPPAKEGEKVETSFFTTIITNPVQSLSKIRDSLLRTFDSPAYFNLTTDYCNNIFNPSTPDDPDVQYFSIAARAVSINPLHPLWWTKLILDHTAAAGEAEKDGFAGSKYEGSDGMVSVSSAKWGECASLSVNASLWSPRMSDALRCTAARSPRHRRRLQPLGTAGKKQLPRTSHLEVSSRSY
jgi:hypothetical protein